MTLNRNDHCWCGSNKKYKQCHLQFDEKIAHYQRNGVEVPPREIIKTPAQIEGIKASAKINTGALDLVAKNIKAGMSTAEIDKLVHDFTVAQGAIPAPLNYQGFPKSCCTSINDEICHGIPSEDVILKDGDIINVDVSTILNGYFSDASRMFKIGAVHPELDKLVDVAKECLDCGLKAAKPWGFMGDIAEAVQKHAESNGYSVVREFGGHGIGLQFHEDPFVSHVGKQEQVCF